jgi:hypothetical protein
MNLLEKIRIKNINSNELYFLNKDGEFESIIIDSEDKKKILDNFEDNLIYTNKEEIQNILK